jgi:hypothetical protein
MQYGVRKSGCAVLFALLAGCATAPDKSLPDWVVNPQSAYPASHYLVAVGEGDTRRAAENSAAAGLARIFEAQIRANETWSETATETAESLERISELRTDVRVGSAQDLLNIQFGEIFTDKDRRLHAAAFIPRAETAEIYRSRIAENNSAVVLLTHKGDSADTPVAKYAFLRAAVRKALENDRLLAQLDIILPGMKDRLSLHYDSKELYTQTAAAARNVTFAIELAGAGGDALREALTGMGFSESSKSPELTFEGKTELEESDLRRASLVFVRYRYTIQVSSQTDSLVLSLHGSRREGHINFEEATARARRSLRTELLSVVPKELGDYLNRLTSADL